MQSTKVLFSSARADWKTPPELFPRIERALGGSIDLDPCSNSDGPPHVPALAHYTEKDDGLAQPWHGTAFVNMPYARGVIDQWCAKAVAEVMSGRCSRVVLLVPARVDTRWWRTLTTPVYTNRPTWPSNLPLPVYVCFVNGRLRFVGAPASAPFPSALVGIGVASRSFQAAFQRLGQVWKPMLEVSYD